MRVPPLAHLSLVRIREFLRELEALFWVFLFPVLLALALGIAFRSGGGDEIVVAVKAGEGAEELAHTLDAAEGLRANVIEADAARLSLRNGRVAIVVVPGMTVTYWFDPDRPEARIARLTVDAVLQSHAGRTDAVQVSDRYLTERGSRYIDFLIPGLLGMNLMGTGMWGVGFYIVNARSRGMLKRLVATPMRRSDYLLSQVLGRLVFLGLEVGLLVGFGMTVFGVPMRGSWTGLFTVSLLGGMTFAGLGLLTASRAHTIEGVSGLMNVVLLPMWILSGIFFSTSRFPDALQPVVQALPLTALNDALRAVMLDGATLAAVRVEMAVLAAWGVAAFAAALVLFRWR